MNTIQFDKVSEHTKDYLAASTLAAVRRFLQTAEGKALKDKTEKETKK